MRKFLKKYKYLISFFIIVLEFVLAYSFLTFAASFVPFVDADSLSSDPSFRIGFFGCLGFGLFLRTFYELVDLIFNIIRWWRLNKDSLGS